MKPSDFAKVQPWNSVKQSSEAETVATNIMKILKRTGDTWRWLDYDEYETERKKDGNYSTRENYYYRDVVDFCVSEDTARLFCPAWKEV